MDVTHLDRSVATLHSLAAEVRRLAAALSAAQGADWSGPAAGQFRERLREEARLAQRCAGLVDDAARLLAEHGRAVGRVR